MFKVLSIVAAVVAFCVVVLGSYVRLSDAGLGCPDWPGCYGALTVPQSEAAIESAQQAYPDKPVEHAKAWKEMAHRYLAGSLGLLVLALAVLAYRQRQVIRYFVVEACHCHLAFTRRNDHIGDAELDCVSPYSQT